MKLFSLHVLLSLRSMRMLAPAAAVAVWIAFIMAYPGTAVAAGAALFIGYLVFGCWITIVVGNIDDDPHRYVLTAVAGSRARLHVLRALVALSYCAVLAALTSVLIVVDVPPRTQQLQTLGALFALGFSGGAMGVSIGTLLHRPVVFNLALTTLGAVLALVGVIALPPAQHLLYRFGKNELVTVWPLLGASVLLACSAIAAGASIAQMRSR